MTRPEPTWQELAERLDALALKLKLHLSQVSNDGTSEAVRDLRTALDDAFTAAGNAIRDEAVGADVREAGRLFLDAFTATLARAGEEVREAIEHRTGRT